MDMIAQTKQATGREIILHFTAAEMGNDGQSCSNDTSMAEALVFWISEGATDRGIVHKAENALGCVDAGGGCGRSLQHITNLFRHSTYSGFTFLRLSADNDNGCVPWNADDRRDYASFISALKGH
jgi:Glycosyl hydrolase family 14